MNQAILRAARRGARHTAGTRLEDDDLVDLVAELKAAGRVVFDPRDLVDGQVLAMHVENERRTTAGQGARRKAKGVCPGVSDLVFLDAPLRVLELKTTRGTVSEAQRAFITYVAGIGGETSVCRGLEAARCQCRAWGYLP